MNYWRKDKTKYESVVTTQHAVGVGFVGTGGRHTHDTYVGVNLEEMVSGQTAGCGC